MTPGPFINFLTDPTIQRAGRGQFTLVTPLVVLDDRGIRHAVPAGFTTDGATIPPFCWPIVGHPYSGSSLRAAIWHDAMCRTESRERRMSSSHVHRLFYLALLADGVARLRATLMYRAVLWFGPTWTVLPSVRT